MLASFVNQYKSKLMVSQVHSQSNDEKQVVPLTKEELAAMKQEGDRDITLDYDLFMKIKNMNRGSKGAGLLKPTVKSKK